ncbi:MAG: FtsW/RodA/SpoVE family cell cycle protein [Planctomycetota bacterium]|jgi:cell division protein FtsW
MLRPGSGLILVTIALLLVGVVMITSAGLQVGGQTDLTIESILLGKTGLMAALAMAALAIGSLFPIRSLERVTGALYLIVPALVVLLLLVHVPGIGHEKNGARRWVELGPIGFQPSELAKWGTLFVVAAYCVRNAPRMGEFLRGFVLPISIVGLLCALIATEDLGTAVLIGAVSTAMLIAAGARVPHAIALTPVATAGVVLALLQNTYRLQRIKTFIDPFADARGHGYHVIQSMAAVSGGGLTGRGLGNSVQKFGYLPEDTTDFIFAIICEELGVAGAVFVAALYAALLLIGLAIVRRTPSVFLRLIALGVMLTIGLQMLINVAVVTGAAPTKGIALPLISSGGTGWVVTCFCLGLLVGIDRTAADSADGLSRRLAAECAGDDMPLDDAGQALPVA